MPVTIAPNPKQQFFNAAGQPLSGGKLFTYAPGTTTLKATFSDAAGAVANPNPIILDARGESLIYWDGVYSIALQDALGNSVYTVDNYPNSSTVQQVAKVANIAALRALRVPVASDAQTVIVDSYAANGDGGGGIFYFNAVSTAADDAGMVINPDGNGSSGRWLRHTFGNPVNVKWFGADPTGTNDSTTAIQAAVNAGIGKTVYIPAGTYKITSQLAFTSARMVGDGITLSVLTKYFNGNLMKVTGGYTTIQGIRLDGNGAAGYTGACLELGGTSFNFTAIASSFIKSIDCPIVFTTRCSNQQFIGCELYAYNSATVYAARVASPDGSSNPANRVFTNCYTDGGCFVDFSGMTTTFVTGCYGATWKTDSNTSKLMMTGSRYTIHQELGHPDLIVDGTDSVIVGNSIEATNAGSIKQAATANNLRFDNTIIMNNARASIVDLAAVGGAEKNYITTLLESYTPTWNGSTTGPTMGNGSIVGYFSRKGNLFSVDIELTKGTSTTVPTGYWTFALPRKAHTTSIGHAQIQLGNGTIQFAQFVVQGGSATGYLYLSGVSGPMQDTALSWSGTCLVTIRIDFLASPS